MYPGGYIIDLDTVGKKVVLLFPERNSDVSFLILLGSKDDW